MDEILKNIYPVAIEAATKNQQEQSSNNNNATTDDVAGDGDTTIQHDHDHDHHYHQYHHSSPDEGFSAYGSAGGGGGGDEVTLEDFLVRTGAVPLSHYQYPSSSSVEDGSHSIQGAVVGKRKAVEETLELDKAALQKQKRMIKNRESAARSRERKQAYTIELEGHVRRLEIEKKLLLEEQMDREKKRLKELKEKIIPITEQRRPKKKLRRTNSS